LSGLRCGWILAEPKLAEQMWRLNDLFAATPVHIAELLSVRAIEQIEKFARRGDALIEENRSAMVEELEGHPAIEFASSGVGTTIFPRLRRGDVAEFCEFLRDGYETSVVPGSYFERPRHFRVGLAGDVEMTREGLSRLARALTVWHDTTSE
jgi:aspartate/methionine/tyrosine aminotransferase